MKERPILFSGEMVRAILDGRKCRRKLYVKKGEDPCSAEHIAKRLANGLDSATVGECWEWRRTRNQFGYGTLTVGGRAVYAHRLAYELSKGEIPEGMHVMHKCDNPSCINPDHLTVGTRSDNMRDCFQKGRSSVSPVSVCGEANGAAKLSSAQVADIRERLEAGAVQRVLADEFGVSQSCISKIKLGASW